MSLKDTINNTNKQKENVKTVANNIDNKLVELGGERATNLADVPNKMQKMLNTYKGKRVIKNMEMYLNGINWSGKSYTISLNIAFVPTLAIVQIQTQSDNVAKNGKNITVYSDLNNTLEKASTDGNVKVYIENVDKYYLSLRLEAKNETSYVLKKMILLQ